MKQFFQVRIKAWPHGCENHPKSPIWHEKAIVQKKLRKFKQKHLR